MAFGWNTGNSAVGFLNWKPGLTRFVSNLRARALMAKASKLAKEADGLRYVAERMVEEAVELKQQARECSRKAVKIAPWIAEER